MPRTAAPLDPVIVRAPWPVRLTRTLWQRRGELLRFGSVGAVAFVVDVSVFNLLLHGPVDVLAHKPVTVRIIAAAVATLVAWVGNRYWTFADRRTSRPARELIEFGLVNIGGLAISASCLAVSRYVLGLDSMLADNVATNVVGLGLSMIFRYVMYRHVVFRGGR